MFNKNPYRIGFGVFCLAITLLSAFIAHHLSREYLVKKNTFFLQIEIETDTVGNWELFWDTGDGFSAGQSDRFHTRVPNLKSTGHFNLPNTRIEQLRIDPLDAIGNATIYSMQLTNDLGDEHAEVFADWSLIPIAGVGDCTREGEAYEIQCTNNDPVLLINFNSAFMSELLTAQGNAASWVPWVIAIGTAILCLLGFSLLGSWMIPVVVSSINWFIFYPGVFSPDSISHIWEATHEHFANWHSPILPIILRVFFNWGIQIPWIILFQTIVGNLVVMWLVENTLKSAFPKSKINRYNAKFLTVTVFIFVFLYSPLTPYSGFTITLWRDVWFTYTFLAIIALGLRIFRFNSPNNKYKGRRFTGIHWRIIPLTILMLFSLLLRQNAIVLAPLYLGIFWLTIAPKGLVKKSVFLVIIAAVFFKGNAFVQKAFDVKDLNPKASIMSLELVGLLKIKPDIRSEFPYVMSQLKPGWEEEFEWANFRKLRWNDKSFVRKDIIKQEPNEKLSQAYFRAVRKHTFSMIYIKLRNYSKLIDPLETTEWYPAGVAENEYDLRKNLYADHIYLKYRKVSFAVYSDPILRWISAVHIVWVIIGSVIALLVLKSLMKKFERQKILVFLLSLLPLAYAASYLLATPWIAFRYIYPATIAIQLFALSVCGYWTLTKSAQLKSKHA